MHFRKIHIMGNDFIVIGKDERLSFDETENTVFPLLSRHFGAGADGAVICSEDNRGNDAVQIIRNGGVRNIQDISGCAAAAAALYAEDGIGNRTIYCADSPYGFSLSRSTGGIISFTAQTGKGTFLPDEIPLSSPYPCIDKPVQTGNRIVRITALNIAGVHAVVFSGSIAALNTDYLGSEITKHSLFRKNADAVFTERTDRQILKIRVFEKGTGTVLSSLSAAAAATLAACRTQKCRFAEETEIICDGGSITAVCNKDMSVTLFSSAHTVYEGNTGDI